VRNFRRDANEKIKKDIKEHLPEDVAKDAENRIQQMTDSYIQMVDKHLTVKRKKL
jgi:ribosome recycling factor